MIGLRYLEGVVSHRGTHRGTHCCFYIWVCSFHPFRGAGNKEENHKLSYFLYSLEAPDWDVPKLPKYFPSQFPYTKGRHS